MLRRTLDGMGDDDKEAGVKEPEHDHVNYQNDCEEGVEYKMKHVVGEYYESHAQLGFSLTNYKVANRYQLWFMKSDRHGVIASCNWLSKNYLKDIIINPKITLTKMKEYVLKMCLRGNVIGLGQRQKK
uniref:Uncharacterized protein n=1 Tax=Lactuca sativa TaxID=4236 RepID=A0A9R1XPZ2_LACSA|nr:hypothetical protein LSAT_V11C200098800 [Lactuca sativa]